MTVKCHKDTERHSKMGGAEPLGSAPLDASVRTAGLTGAAVEAFVSSWRVISTLRKGSLLPVRSPEFLPVRMVLVRLLIDVAIGV